MGREVLLLGITLLGACGEDPKLSSFEPRVPQSYYFDGHFEYLRERDEHGSINPKTRPYDKVTILVPPDFVPTRRKDSPLYRTDLWWSNAWPEVTIRLEPLIRYDVRHAVGMPCFPWQHDSTARAVRVVSRQRIDGSEGLCLDGKYWHVAQMRYLSSSTILCTVSVPRALAPLALYFLNVCNTITSERCDAPYGTDAFDLSPATCVPERR